MPSPGGINFQNFLLETSNNIELLFYWTISQILFVALGVFSIIWINYLKGGFYRYENAIPYYEVLWTLFPSVILISVATPSIWLLYHHEQEPPTNLSVNSIGHQWYWSYEYGDFINIELDSFIIPSEELYPGISRFLEVDNRIVVPGQAGVRLFITSEDVIHAWAIPSLGLNIDATPGRLNTVFFTPLSIGVFLGQCSELCGANHSFMPIVLEVTTPLLLTEWLSTL